MPDLFSAAVAALKEALAAYKAFSTDGGDAAAGERAARLLMQAELLFEEAIGSGACDKIKPKLTEKLVTIKAKLDGLQPRLPAGVIDRSRQAAAAEAAKVIAAAAAHPPARPKPGGKPPPAT
eukprot:SAG11_NODE_2578_length_3200_cov_2.960013_1_plen_121_part_10